MAENEQSWFVSTLNIKNGITNVLKLTRGILPFKSKLEKPTKSSIKVCKLVFLFTVIIIRR